MNAGGLGKHLVTIPCHCETQESQSLDHVRGESEPSGPQCSQETVVDLPSRPSVPTMNKDLARRRKQRRTQRTEEMGHMAHNVHNSERRG